MLRDAAAGQAAISDAPDQNGCPIPRSMDASQPQPTSSAAPSADSSPTVRQQAQQQHQQQHQQQQQTSTQSLVVVSSSGGSGIPLVNSITSGGGNAVVLSAQSAMSATTAQLMTQAAGVAQNTIRLPIQQQQQQHLIMAPMNNLMFGNYLQGGHPVLTQGGGQYIIQNLPALQNQSIFQLPPHSSNMTITSRRSTVTNAQNIQPRPQSQLLPAPMAQQVYRTNLSQQIIAQSSGVTTTPANIQPRPQSYLQASPMIRTANIAPQLFAPQSFQQVFSQNPPAGLCWTGQPGANSGFILRSQNDPIQFLQTQAPLQIPFVQNNVQVPSNPAPVVPVTPAATTVVQATTQATISTTAAPARFKPIATRPAASSSTSTSTSMSMGTQTAPRTTTTAADTTKSAIRPKMASGPGRPATVTPSPSSKPQNGPVTQVREADASSTRSPAPNPQPPVVRSDVSSTNTPTSNTGDQKVDVKPVKGSPVPPFGVRKENNKEGAADRMPAAKRSGEKRDAPLGHENLTTSGPGKKIESPRLRNGVKSVNECKKTAEPEKVTPDILIHVIEDYVIEESSKPFPVNGTGDQSHGENGSSRSDRVSNRSDSPEEIYTPPRSRLPSDAGECQRCQNTGPKSRLKLKSGMRVCAPCFSLLSKRPASKLDQLNPVSGCISEYDFPGTDVQPAAKGGAVQEPEVVVTNDGRKKARLSKKVASNADVPVSWRRDSPRTCNHSIHLQVPAQAKVADSVPAPQSGQPVASSDVTSSPATKSEVAGLFLPESGSNPLKWNVSFGLLANLVHHCYKVIADCVLLYRCRTCTTLYVIWKDVRNMRRSSSRRRSTARLSCS